jgi:glycosyltransferase involved in cell wall biosynthesis
VEIYRITLPYTNLNNSSNMRCGWMPVEDAAQCLRQMQTDVVFRNDVIVLHRSISDMPDAGEALTEALRVHGAKVVYETDDDYSGQHRESHSERAGLTWAPYLPYVDAATVTTKPLGQLVERESGGKPVYVVPNAVDYQWFTQVAKAAQRPDPRLTVMLAGTKTHYDDWKVVGEVMPDILAAHPDVRLVVAGDWMGYDYLHWADKIPPVHYAEYPATLAQADILCAPLVPDDPFNACKSPIKAIEGWCAARPLGKRQGGCAVIATKCGVYRDTVQNRHNGLLVDHTPEAWDKALRLLIGDEYLRRKLQIEGLKDARQYDIATRWRDWHTTYTHIAGGDT